MALFKFEHKSEPMAGGATLAGRLIINFVVAAAIVAIALAIGMGGYRITENMDWLDAFLNASMLLGGMGPVDQLHTEAGKLFAGGYALFCGLVIVIVTGIVLAPLLHRVLHALHVEDDDK
jgi:hypothetical protein